MNEAATQDAVQWLCLPCGHIYDPAQGDPEHGIAAGTRFEDVNESYVCPVCGVGKDEFVPV
ncbi:rubredoxin [uncultured Hydrogenophaga sp.]|uniref:rubredoxin n=1 Tax=uncultured Hydrogenophaga sp. TaxID=199683 RepID=UPI00258F4B43|nr:rubredoxin [uncultured Hydrogenophaga sp.]